MTRIDLTLSEGAALTRETSITTYSGHTMMIHHDKFCACCGEKSDVDKMGICGSCRDDFEAFLWGVDEGCPVDHKDDWYWNNVETVGATI